MFTALRIAIVMASVSIVDTSLSAQELHASFSHSPERNPRRLDAAPLLGLSTSNTSRRVRFEWDQVPGATEYVLNGKWTTPRSWTVHKTEFHVTRRVARQWDDRRVILDATLPPGNHSWGVVTVFRSGVSGDIEHATMKSFVIR